MSHTSDLAPGSHGTGLEGSASLPTAATVRGHRDLRHQLGLEPLADTHGKGHP